MWKYITVGAAVWGIGAVSISASDILAGLGSFNILPMLLDIPGAVKRDHIMLQDGGNNAVSREAIRQGGCKLTIQAVKRDVEARNPESSFLSDLDGNGVSDAGEAVAASNPVDASSYFCISYHVHYVDGSGGDVGFNTATGRGGSVCDTTNLLSEERHVLNNGISGGSGEIFLKSWLLESSGAIRFGRIMNNLTVVGV